MENKSYDIKYLGDLRVSMVHLKSGSEILTDAPIDNNGKGQAFSPTDLLAASLVSCILTIAGIHYDKKGVILKPIHCEVKKVMQNEPRRIAEIFIEFDFGANEMNEKEILVFKRIVETCPVTLSLNPELKIHTNLAGLLS